MESESLEIANLLASFSEDDPKAILEATDSGISRLNVIANAVSAIEAGDNKRLEVVLKSVTPTQDLTEAVTYAAVNNNKLDLLLAAVTKAVDGEDFKRVIGDCLDGLLHTDFDRTLQALKPTKYFTNVEIVTMAFSANNNLGETDLKGFKKCIKLQKELLNKEERQKFSTSSFNDIICSLDLKTLRANPTLLEFMGAASALAFDAVRCNDLGRLEFIEESGVEFNKQPLLAEAVEVADNRKQNTMMLWMQLKNYPTTGALGAAVRVGNTKAFNSLLKNNPTPTDTAEALFAAISCKDVKSVKSLLEFGVDCNTTTANPQPVRGEVYAVTPLGCAIVNYDSTVLNLIMPNATLDNKTHGYIDETTLTLGALIYASESKHELIETLKFLVAKDTALVSPLGPESDLDLETPVWLA